VTRLALQPPDSALRTGAMEALSSRCRKMQEFSAHQQCRQIWCFSHCRNMRELGLHPVSLHYLDPGQEQGYVIARSPDLMVATTTVMTFLVSVVLITVPTLRFSRDAHPSDQAFKISKLRYMVQLVCMLLWTIVAIWAKFPQCYRRLNPWARELFVGLFVAVTLWPVIGLSEWHTAAFLGYDPLEVYGKENQVVETTMLLGIVVFASFIHLSLPLRWMALLPLEVTGILVYPLLLTCFGTPQENGAKYNTIIMTGVVVGLSLGKWKLEYFERLAFHTVVREKIKRVQAEFKLSMRPAESSVQPSVHKSASKADTADLFSNLCDDRNLTRVAGLGHREHWLLSTKDIMLQPSRRLGQGSFGVVIEGSFCGTPVAVKLANGLIPSSIQGLPQLANELRVLRRVRHPNIVLFHGGCIDVPNKCLAIVLELIRGDALNHFLRPAKVPPGDGDRYIVLLGIARGLTYLHMRDPCVVHGDMSDGNIMVERLQHEPRAKLLDFGLSRILSPHSRPLGGTCHYMAPEVIKGHTPAKASADVFSLGRIFYHVATGRRPWDGEDKRTIQALTISGDVRKLDWPEHPFAQICMTAAEKCTQPNPALRPDMKTVGEDLVQWPEHLDMFIQGSSMIAHLGAARCSSGMEWSAGIHNLHATLSPSSLAVLNDQMLSSSCLAVLVLNDSECTRSSIDSRSFHASQASGAGVMCTSDHIHNL